LASFEGEANPAHHVGRVGEKLDPHEVDHLPADRPEAGVPLVMLLEVAAKPVFFGPVRLPDDTVLRPAEVGPGGELPVDTENRGLKQRRRAGSG
jgi:hypothetical protein